MSETKSDSLEGNVRFSLSRKTLVTFLSALLGFLTGSSVSEVSVLTRSTKVVPVSPATIDHGTPHNCPPGTS